MNKTRTNLGFVHNQSDRYMLVHCAIILRKTFLLNEYINTSNLKIKQPIVNKNTEEELGTTAGKI